MTAVQYNYGSDNNNGNNGNNNGNNIGTNTNPIPNYFKLGSLTRRHSVIGCIGYEYANPQKEEEKEETKEETKETWIVANVPTDEKPMAVNTETEQAFSELALLVQIANDIKKLKGLL